MSYILLLLLKGLGVGLLSAFCATVLLHVLGFILAVVVYNNPSLRNILFKPVINEDKCLIDSGNNSDKTRNKRGYCKYFKYFYNSYCDAWWGAFQFGRIRGGRR